MRVVVDTNIFVSAVMGADSASRQVIRLCMEGALAPLMGKALLSEYEDVCGRDQIFKQSMISREQRGILLDAFMSCCTWVPIYYLWRPNLKDEADNHLIELAIGGRASMLITANKRDFRQAELLFPQLKVLNAGELLAERRS